MRGLIKPSDIVEVAAKASGLVLKIADLQFIWSTQSVIANDR